VDDAIRAEIRSLVRQNRRVEAIHAIVWATGMSLQDASEWVTREEAAALAEHHAAVSAAPDLPPVAPGSAPVVGSRLALELSWLIRRDRYLDAIRAYAERVGCDLETARTAVWRFAADVEHAPGDDGRR